MAVKWMNAWDLSAIRSEGSLLAGCEAKQLVDLLSCTQVEFTARREVLIHRG